MPGPSPYGFSFGPRVDFEVIGRAWSMITSDMGTWVVASLLVIVIAYGVMAALMVPLFLDMFQQISKSVAQSQSNPSSITPFQGLPGTTRFLLVGAGDHQQRVDGIAQRGLVGNVRAKDRGAGHFDRGRFCRIQTLRVDHGSCTDHVIDRRLRKYSSFDSTPVFSEHGDKLNLHAMHRTYGSSRNMSFSGSSALRRC